MDLETLEKFKALVNPEVLPLLSDGDCGRFLRARNMDTTKAADMANTWGKWYTTTAECGTTAPIGVLDNIVDRNEHIYTSMCPLSHMGEDLEGCPIYWEQSGDISQRFGQLADLISLDDMVTRHIRNQVYSSFNHFIYFKISKSGISNVQVASSFSEAQSSNRKASDCFQP